MMRLAWYDFSVDLPDDWEVTRYSVASPTGRFEFTNRDGALGRLSWETGKNLLPDEEKILSEYHSRYLRQYDKEGFQSYSGIHLETAGIFRVGFRNTGEPCQAVTHLADCRKTIMWVFPSYSEDAYTTLWKPILESFAPNAGEIREWSAFGIHTMLPREFDLERAECKPADASLAFERRNLHKVFMHRWGLPRELLRRGGMDLLMRNVLAGHRGRALTSTECTFRGMDSVETEIEIQGTRGMDSLYSSKLPGRGRIWHNRVEKRMYAFLQAAPAKIDLLNENEVLPV